MHRDRSRPYSSFALLGVLLDHARPLVAVPLLAAVLAAGLTLAFGRDWMASSTFKPQSEAVSGQAGRLAGIAGQLGVNIGSLSEGESVDFFARLARSRALLGDIARDTFVFAVEEGSADSLAGTILELYEIEGETDAERLRNAVDRLEKSTAADIDLNAGLVTVRTDAPWQGLAVDLNRAVLDGINRWNLEERQSQARVEREFTKVRLDEARAELEEAENALRRFLERNRRFDNVPELRLEYDALQRRVDLRQQVYTSLAQSHEQARLDEVRNTPVITVIDPPGASVRREGGVLRNALFGGLLGLLFVMGWIFMREYLARERAMHPEEWEELAGRGGRGRVRSA